jgi:tetratricopeptide (TPR) repeat protein
MSDELKQQGLMQFRQRSYDEAVATFGAAVEAYAQAGDEGKRLEMLNNIGVTQRMQRQWDASEQSLEQARQGFATLGERVQEAQVMANIGDLYADRREWEQAANHYSDSAAQFAGAAVSSEERWMHSQVLRALSLLRLRQRRWIEAMDLMRQSLEARPRLGPHGWLFRAMLRLVFRLFGGG